VFCYANIIKLTGVTDYSTKNSKGDQSMKVDIVDTPIQNAEARLMKENSIPQTLKY
jgi:hypothetical protein